jgi:hypothetical protein
MSQLTPQQAAAAYLLLLDDASSSEEDEEMLLLAARRLLRPSHRTLTLRWWEDTASQMDEQQFKQQFRLSFNTFHSLAASLSAAWVGVQQRGRQPVDCSKALAMLLWRLANTVTWREVGQQFGFERAHVHKLCNRLMLLINRIHAALISMPSTQQEWEMLRTQWAPHAKVANVVAAVDGTHIMLLYPPSLHRKAFINRKNLPTIVAQAVVDHRHLFRNVVVGAEGSAHDANVWQRSAVRQHI